MAYSHKSIEGFFRRVSGEKAWRKGKSLYADWRGQLADITDGIYEAEVTDAFFDPDSVARGSISFIMETTSHPKGKKLIKQVALDSGQNIFLILADFSRMGFELDSWHDLEDVFGTIRLKRPGVMVKITTDEDGIRKIKILGPATIVSRRELQDIQRIPKEIKPESADPEAPENSTDLAVGHVIRFHQSNGTVLEGTVRKIAEDESLIDVEVDGEIRFVTPNDVLEVVG